MGLTPPGHGGDERILTMPETLKVISKQTAVSLGLLLIVVAVVWRSSWCLACMEGDIKDNQKTIMQQNAEIVNLRESVRYLERAMVRIETKLGTLPRGTTIGVSDHDDKGTPST